MSLVDSVRIDGREEAAIGRRHVAAATVLGIVVLLAFSFARGRTTQTIRSLASYTSMAGKLHPGTWIDGVAYLQMADSHHGGVGTNLRPFTSRWLIPTIAGHLPIDAGDAMVITNLLLFIAGLVCLVLLTRSCVKRPASLLLGAAMYGAAIPVVQFASGYFVDTGTVGLVAIGVWATYRRRWWWGLVALFVAMMAKEAALVLVPFGIAVEWTRHPAPRRRWARTAAWCGTGAVAYLVTAIVGRSGRILFDPWIPSDLRLLAIVARGNLSRPSAWLTVGLTLFVPVVAVTIAWLARRRGWFRIENDVLVPMALGILAAGLLSLWAALGAWWDARGAWVALPFGVPVAALVIDAILVDGIASTFRARSPRRILLGSAAGFLLVVVALTAICSKLDLHAAQAADLPLRFAQQPTSPATTRMVVHHGQGDANVPVSDVGDGRPVLLDVEVPGRRAVRVSLVGSNQALFNGVLDGSGTFLIDPPEGQPMSSTSVAIQSDGSWTVRFRNINTADYWGNSHALEGHGPAVMLIPGGGRISFTADFTSTRGPASFRLVGHCHVAECPDARAGQLPLGLEALVVNDPGDWSVHPVKVHGTGDAVTMDELERSAQSLTPH
jgi:hypothetical protein